MLSGHFYPNSLDRSFLIEGMSGWFLLLLCFIEISVFNANSVDPDQTPRFAASDLGLRCLQCSFYRTLGINELNVFIYQER